MKKIFLILAVVLTMIPATVVADGINILVGAQSVSFGADLGEYYDISPGPGVEVMVGLDLGILFDIRAGGRTATEGNSGEDLTYTWIEAGPRFLLCEEGASLCADWFVGAGSYDLEIGNVEFDTAAGGFIGLGIEEEVSDKYVGRFEVKGVYWKSDTGKTDAPSLNFSLLVGWKL